MQQCIVGILYTIMKHLSFVIDPSKQRHHRKQRRHSELFDPDLPFRNRVERPKTEYQRRAKHVKREEQWWYAHDLDSFIGVDNCGLCSTKVR